MSKGNPVYLTRIAPELEKAMLECIARRNENSPNEPWTIAEFIRSAIREKIAHMERSRKRKGSQES